MIDPCIYPWHKMPQADWPRHMQEAYKLLNVKEKQGREVNPVIISWAKETNIPYTDDATPWCGLFVAVTLFRAGREILPSWENLRAMAWKEYGTYHNRAMFGDLLIFTRQGGGHVGYYAGEDLMHYHVLGGNQSDSVCIVKILKSRCYFIRRPAYKNPPVSVKQYIVNVNGEVSDNEQ